MTMRLHKYQWAVSIRGNHYLKDGDDLRATVYANRWGGWQIVINGQPGGFVQGEVFADADDAIDRAEDILDGADCDFAPAKGNG